MQSKYFPPSMTVLHWLSRSLSQSARQLISSEALLVWQLVHTQALACIQLQAPSQHCQNKPNQVNIKSSRINKTNQIKKKSINPYQSFATNQTKWIKPTRSNTVQCSNQIRAISQIKSKIDQTEKDETSLNSYRQPLLKLSHGLS